MKITIPISLGELYDKISILEIKQENISDLEKISNINKELLELKILSDQYPIDSNDYLQLVEVNKRIWDIEDGIREEERNKDWGEDFIKFARAIYFTNDKRAEIKKQINTSYGSEIIEEKSYAKY